MSVRNQRLQSIFQKEITNIIQNEIKDPKLGFVTVSDVSVTNDLSYAKVYVSFLGKDQRNEAGLKILIKARGFIRSQLAKRVKVYKVPELEFIIDDSLKKAQRIDDILNKIHSED